MRSILVRTFIRKHNIRDKFLAALLRKGLGGPIDMSDNTQTPYQVSIWGKAYFRGLLDTSELDFKREIQV